MQSHQHVQQVWDSFVTHLKGMSEALQTAYEVFSQPEEDIKASVSSTSNVCRGQPSTICGSIKELLSAGSVVHDVETAEAQKP